MAHNLAVHMQHCITVTKNPLHVSCFGMDIPFLSVGVRLKRMEGILQDLESLNHSQTITTRMSCSGNEDPVDHKLVG